MAELVRQCLLADILRLACLLSKLSTVEPSELLLDYHVPQAEVHGDSL
jgi:hypothetical protein